MKLNEISSRDCRKLIDGGDILAVVPVGSPERLGPHLPLGERSIVAETVAGLVADRHRGIQIPLIPYSAVYDPAFQRGSIDIDTQAMHRYFTDVSDELYANGFKKIIFVGFHDELYYLCHEYFQQKNKAVLFLTPDSFKEHVQYKIHGLDGSGAELWRFVACLKLSGNEKTLRKTLDKNRECFGKYLPVKSAGREALGKFGNNGCSLGPDEYRFYPVNLGESLGESGTYRQPDDILIDAAASELSDWIGSMSGQIDALSVFQSFLDENPAKRAVW